MPGDKGGKPDTLPPSPKPTTTPPGLEKPTDTGKTGTQGAPGQRTGKG